MPGTSPDYWMSADDRLTATMLDLLEQRSKDREASNRKASRKGR